MRNYCLWSVMFLLLLGGCAGSTKGDESTGRASLPWGNARLATAQAPLPTGYLLSTQPKMQAMHHWDQHAEKIARNTSRALDHFLRQQSLPVYVVPGPATAFSKTFQESLITYLIGYGVPVTLSAEDAVVLENNIEYVTHHRRLVRNTKGQRSSLEPGFKQGKNEMGRYKRPAIVGEESGYFAAAIPSTEVQINTSLMHQGNFLYRDSSIFYVDRADGHHYQQHSDRDARGLKRFQIVGH